MVHMEAAVLHRPGPVESTPLHLQEVPLPHPGPGQVRLRVTACSVCHTDLHTVEGELPLPRLPVIPGHQVVGVVDTLGPPEEVSPSKNADSPPASRPALRPGQRVGVPWLYRACGHCPYCRRGQENLCQDALFTGLDVDGGYAQYIVAPAAFAVPIPDRFSDLEAAPLLCAGIIGYRSLRLSELEPGETLALFGFGASAHLALQVARQWGCQVYVFTRSRQHQELALALGAAWAGTPTEEPPAQADRAITFAPVGHLIPLALKRVRKGGTVAINAIHLDGIPAFDYGLLYHERTLRSVTNSTRQDAREFMEEAARIPIRVSSQAYPLSEANRALADLKHGLVQGAAVLVM